MTNRLKVALALGLGVTLLQCKVSAEQNPAGTNAPVAPKLSPAEQKKNMSYAIGMNIGNSIKRGGIELDVEAMSGAIKDVLAGGALKLTEPQAQEAMRAYQMEARSKHEEMQKQAAGKNKKEGEAFLAENKKKPGVKTHAVTCRVVFKPGLFCS